MKLGLEGGGGNGWGVAVLIIKGKADDTLYNPVALGMKSC